MWLCNVHTLLLCGVFSAFLHLEDGLDTSRASDLQKRPGMRSALLLLFSCAISIVAAEGIVRLFFDPIDILLVETEEDPILNHRIPAYAAGHDEMGFRNKAGLREADILAIGDSMTYGVTASADESWPSHLQRITERDVYSAGLGGYGPFHYLHLARDLTPKVRPKHVIICLYTGNDFLDAYNLVYSNENWAQHRSPGNTDAPDRDLFIASPSPGKFLGSLRNTLAKTSVLYRLLTQNALIDGLRTNERLDRDQARFDAFLVRHLDEDVLMAPKAVNRFSDMQDPRIQEAVDLTKTAFEALTAEILASGATPLYVFMPMRETVYLPHVQDQLTESQLVDMVALREDQDEILAEISAFLEEIDAPYVDLRSALTDALQKRQIYPPADGHPNGIGYGVVAEQIARAMTQGAN